MSSNTNYDFQFNPKAQYLFKRAYTVSFAPPGQASALQYGTESFNGKDPAPLRVTFDIDKQKTGTNTSKIQIYNQSIQSRQSIKKGSLIQLQAGYNGLLENLFLGSVNISSVDRKDADTITSLECIDGGAAISNARLDKSYGAGTTLAQILQDVGTAMGTATSYSPSPINAGIAVGIPNVVYNKGFMAHGACADTLRTLLSPLGLEWSIQNNNLNIIPITGNTGSTAIIVSSGVLPVSTNGSQGVSGSIFDPTKATGMIGVPSENVDFVQFVSLLNPKLVPGCLVQLISENTSLNGFYTLRRCHYEGDSHDNKWQVTCEATPAPGIQQNLPLANGFDYGTAIT